MTNHAEEQELEVEALESIFLDDFEKISATEFYLHLVPDPSAPPEENHVKATLHVTYTPTYPDDPPCYSIKAQKGLEGRQIQAMKDLVEQEIDNNRGMVMIYTIAEALQNYLRENNKPQLSMHEEMLLRKTGDDADADKENGPTDTADGEGPQPEFKGLADKVLCRPDERVTDEQFATWKASFKQEMVALGYWKVDTKADRLTGKQLFESDATLKDFDEELPEEDDPNDIRKQVFNESVFDEEDELNEDDLLEDD
mmetsp:Transcript_18855/g.45398  ORF Transcript_18855/g.45398 Transcript_18855/m.45398 type:complete len:255 (+) Transcript_18855:97-861(+)